ncbi:MAG: GxxExxY protein [Anaerolineales bacterium]|nr:GxxExxY protein [Anaerolineales bacterium]
MNTGRQARRAAEVLYPALSYQIVGAAMEVHNVLGPGFLEAVYHTALAHELSLRGVPFESEKALPVRYKEQIVGQYEADLVVDDKIIIEIKSTTSLHSAHFAQAQHYLSATGLRLALLINFGAKALETKRIVQ